MFINNISGSELVTLASTIAISLSKELNSEELASLGSFLTTLGDNLSLLSVKPEKYMENSNYL